MVSIKKALRKLFGSGCRDRPPIVPCLGSLILGLLLSAGCANSRNADARAGRTSAWFSPKPPVFITGPASLLLTNEHGYSAHLVMETFASSNRVRTISGELLCRGTKILFAPAADSSAGKRPRAGGNIWIWDSANSTGYLLNEALEGFAPIDSKTRFTNVVTLPLASASGNDRIEGHPCRQEQVQITPADGLPEVVQAWRAVDLGGLPLRLRTTMNFNTVIVNLSEVRLEAPAPGLFFPPPDFTRYESAESMLTELMSRQMNAARRRPSYSSDEFDSTNQRQRYRNPSYP